MSAHALSEETVPPLPVAVLPFTGRPLSWPLLLGRSALALCWLIGALVASVVSGQLLPGLLISAAIVADELFASRDDFGSKALSGALAILAILLVGWPWGIVIALGPVLFGDGLLRGTPLSRMLYWAVLLGIMLGAASWTVGVAGTIAFGPGVPRTVAAVSFAIFAGWTALQLRNRRPRAIAGGGILAIIGTALAGPWWMPMVPHAAAPWVGAGMMGMGAAAGFMLADMVLSSAVAWRRSGRSALLFWPEHMPVLFARYAGQGVLAGLAAYSFTLGGAPVLTALLLAGLCAQLLYHLQRRVSGVMESIVDALSSAIDARDSYTAGHSARVGDYAARVALQLGWSKAQIERTRTAGLLHDVGKLGVADDVLHKPGSLDHAEYSHIQQHARIGQQIVSRVGGLRCVALIVGQHHERWDGAGYPDQLRGEQIRPEARLVAIADVYDAMTTARPYRGALPEDDVLAHLEREAGHQFDPALVKVFLRTVQDSATAGVMFCYCATH